MDSLIPTPPARDDYQLTEDWRLLNHGSYGACPKPVFEVYQAWQAEFERHPGDFMGRHFELMDTARGILAEYLHTAPGNVGFVTNATMGVNVVSNSLQSMLKPGDEILSTNHEYNACRHAWQFACERTGARYVEQEIPLPVYDKAAVIEKFWAGVTDRTRVIYLSHITSPTALTFPVTEICARAREEGILTVIDGAHAPGQRSLYLDEIGADFYTGNCHKWMCSPKGTAFLHARPEAQKLIQPLIVGHYWVPGEHSKKPLQDYVEQYGTRDLSGFLTVPSAIEYMRERSWDEVRARSFALCCETRSVIENICDTESLYPDDTDWMSQLVAIRLPNQLDTAKFSARLKQDYHIEIPVIKWNDVNILRLSVQHYTTGEDINALIDAVTHLIKEGV